MSAKHEKMLVKKRNSQPNKIGRDLAHFPPLETPRRKGRWHADDAAGRARDRFGHGRHGKADHREGRETAGFASKHELLADLYDRDEDIYRIELHWVGEDPRKELRTNDKLTQQELDEIIDKLRKLDGGSQRGNWTQLYLQMIHDQPNTHAQILAESIGLTIPTFKPWVRKLKALGLTEISKARL